MRFALCVNMAFWIWLFQMRFALCVAFFQCCSPDRFFLCKKVLKQTSALISTEFPTPLTPTLKWRVHRLVELLKFPSFSAVVWQCKSRQKAVLAVMCCCYICGLDSLRPVEVENRWLSHCLLMFACGSQAESRWADTSQPYTHSNLCAIQHAWHYLM